MAPLNVLICGGGVGGPALAWWLARQGHKVTIVERFPALRASGAQIDLRIQGFEVVKKMGLRDAVISKKVHEEGFEFVDENDRQKASMPVSASDSKTQTMTAEFEIMRGDLVRILHDATKDNVTYIFGKTVEKFEQDDKAVHVHFSDGASGSYDMLVGADGQGSRIRADILPPGSPDPKHSLNLFFAYYFVPRTEAEGRFAKCYLMPDSRAIMTRSHAPDTSQVYLAQRSDDKLDAKGIQKIPRASREEQMAFFKDLFKSEKWHVPRLLEGMDHTDNFYCQEIIQIKTDTWSKGRVVLLADAAHCPSPMTGMGTTSAFVGAYVLAGEISKSPDDLPKAFAEYDRTLRPFVDQIQKLPPGMDHFFFHKTKLGIWLLHNAVYWSTRLKLDKVAGRFAAPAENESWALPVYPNLKAA